MENELQNKIQNLTPEEATEIRKLLKGKSKYTKKGVYREKENKLRYLTPDEWNTFILNLKDNLKKYYWFLLLTGVRYKEAKLVKKKQIDWSNRSIILFKTKGGVQRNVNFSSFGKKKIKEMFDGLTNEDTLSFPTHQHLDQTLHKVLGKLKFQYWKDISIHNIRKQHENYLHALNLDGAKITAHMGHTPKTAAEHYNASKFIKDAKQLEKIKEWFDDIFGS